MQHGISESDRQKGKLSETHMAAIDGRWDDEQIQFKCGIGKSPKNKIKSKADSIFPDKDSPITTTSGWCPIKDEPW